MQQKVIFLDIDGTLVLPSGEVSTKVKEAISKVRQNGHYVFLCTGRNRAGVRNLMDIGFDGVICSAGGYIEINGHKIYESFLSNDDLQEAREAFERNYILYILETTHTTYCSEDMLNLFVEGSFGEKCTNSEMQRIINEQKKRLNMKDITEFDENPKRVHKICFIAKSRESLEKVKQLLEYKYKFVVHDLFAADTINGEIIINGTNKGKAIQQVMKELHLPMENTIGFGDSLNDLEMIEACHYSVVMENGVDELKKHASHVCESVYDDGIYHELKRLGLF